MRSYEIGAIRAWPHDPDRLIDSLLMKGTLGPIATVIDWVREGLHSFWMQGKDERIRVIAARHWTSGRWFLKTEGQGSPMLDLLALRYVS